MSDRGAPAVRVACVKSGSSRVSVEEDCGAASATPGAAGDVWTETVSVMAAATTVRYEPDRRNKVALVMAISPLVAGYEREPCKS
jgi:hypothetical protein